jgi:ABC-type polysaccharide/polyol phosphate export permease
LSARAQEGPPTGLRYRRRLRLGGALWELWRARELLRTLAERELRVRYKQALLGFAWAVVTPVVMMVVFSLFIGRVARVDTGGAPYPLFAFLGLVPWTFFSASVSQGGMSLLVNATLLNKVYCPREVFPIASVLVAGFDSLIATAVLGLLFVVTGESPAATTVWIPLLLAIQVGFTVGVVLVVSPALIYLGDLRHAVPIALQVGLFATPVAFGLDVVPEALRGPYVAINPLAAVIDGYRRTVLLGYPPDWHLTLIGGAAAATVLIGGYALFKRLETGVADVV